MKKPTHLTTVNKIGFVLFALFLSIINEIYLRLFADFYVANFYESLVPDFGGFFAGFLGRLYLDLIKVPFSTFIFIQIIFFIIVFNLLRHFLKLKRNILQILVFSLLASMVSFLTVTPKYLSDLAKTVYFIPDFFYVALLLIIIVHIFFVSLFFYFFMNMKNKN